MSEYLDTLKTEQIGREFTLLAELRLKDDAQDVLTVPAGFTTNYASLAAFHNILLFVIYALLVTYGNRACTTHDWLYTEGKLSRKDCDDVFYRALRADGVAKWRAAIFWVGVRIGGASHYSKTPQAV
jgi:hypothetical protein